MTAEAMVATVLDETADWSYERASIGYPGPVLGGCPVRAGQPRARLGRV